MPRTTFRVAAAVAAAVAVAAVPLARAADPMPEPTSCAGINVTDPAGDQELNALGVVNTGEQTPDNTDVIAGFWRYVPDATGKNVLTANIRVTKLDTEVQTGSLGHLWYWYFDIGDYTWFVSAGLDTAGEFTYGYGDLGETSAGNTTQGETTGKVFEGDKGIIQIVVPLDKIKPDGKTLGNGHIDAKVSFRNVIPTVDRAPDGTAGAKPYKAIPCAEPAAPTTGATTTAPVESEPPPAVPAGPATLDLKVTAPKLRAKTVSKKKGFAIGLRAGERLTNLAVSLRKGKKTVGKGKLAALEPGSGKLKIRVAKKIKKGTYTIAYSATKADGRSASAAVRVRIR